MEQKNDTAGSLIIALLLFNLHFSSGSKAFLVIAWIYFALAFLEVILRMVLALIQSKRKY